MAKDKRIGATRSDVFHELGVRGRKTGAVLHDTGERDAHGMQPIDHIFSSPTKPADGINPDATQGEASMDVDFEPALNPSPKRMLPHARAPIKTHLKSPARKNPVVAARSAPNAASQFLASTRRNLFSPELKTSPPSHQAFTPLSSTSNSAAEESREVEAAPAQKKPKKAGRPQKKKPDNIGDVSLLEVQKGPPLPKGRGLVSYRSAVDDMATTRSGRHSVRPLAWWKGEHAVVEEAMANDVMAKNSHFTLPTIKEIVRVADEDPSRQARTRRPAKRRADDGRQQQYYAEPLEPWEENPGIVKGYVFAWQPEHALEPPGPHDDAELAEEQLAISAAEVQPRDIHDASFRFAKTLSMPFMGAGIVDLPPGAEKKPKNSRRMHMVFFVFYGRVLVTVNETEFRISAGGTWFVPRGNYYRILNDYDDPARLFFAQACENLVEMNDNGGMETQLL